MFRFILLPLASIALTGCASFKYYPPSPYKMPSQAQCALAHAEFCSLYSRIENLSSAYASQAKELGNSSTALNIFTFTAATSTLAFAGFDAHPDNTLASTLVTGVSSATAQSLRPGARAQLRARGVNALGCIASKAESLDSRRVRFTKLDPQSFASTGDLNISTIDSSGIFGVVTNASTYESFDNALILLMMAGQQIEKPSDGLIAAIANAQSSRERLAKGMSARNAAFSKMSDAIDSVQNAIESETAPSVSELIDLISKIELPKATPAPSSGQSDPPAAADKAASTAAAAQAEMDAANLDRTITLLLNLTSAKIAQIEPEKDAELVAGMQGCLARLVED